MSGSSPSSGSRSQQGVSRPPRSRPPRERGIRESLLGIVLILEAVVLFFATLVVFGLKALPTPVALGGGAVFIVVLFALAALQRSAAAVWIGAIAQLALIATGILTPFMYVIGAGFAALWVYCFLRARQIERQHRLAAESESP